MPSQKVKVVAVNDVEYTDVDTGKKALAKKGATIFVSADEYQSLAPLKAVRKPKNEAEKEAPVNDAAGIVNEAPAADAVGDREASSKPVKK